jgi:hypothetical protein
MRLTGLVKRIFVGISGPGRAFCRCSQRRANTTGRRKCAGSRVPLKFSAHAIGSANISPPRGIIQWIERRLIKKGRQYGDVSENATGKSPLPGGSLPRKDPFRMKQKATNEGTEPTPGKLNGGTFCEARSAFKTMLTVYKFTKGVSSSIESGSHF